MAFPTPAATATSNNTSPTTSHAVTLPSGVASGDLLIAIVGVGFNTTISGWPAGWVSLVSTTYAPANEPRLEVRYKRATGSEVSFNLTSAANTVSVVQTLRITGGHASTAPEAASSSGSSSTPNPPSLDPATWGTEDTLWLVAECNDVSTIDITAYPASFTSDQYTSTATGTGVPKIAVASRSATVASLDPSAFTLNALDSWVAATIAVRPMPPPTASFTFDNTTPMVVTFTDTSTAAAPATIVSRTWSFGDATQDTVSPVTHNYASPGTKNVQLEVTDSNGLSNSVTVPVPVLSSLQVSGATSNEAPGPVKMVTKPLAADTPLDATLSTRTGALASSAATANEGTASKLVTRPAQASTANEGTLSTLFLLPENRQGLAVRRDAQGRLYVNPDYLTGARRDAQGRAFVDPDATNSVARVDTEGRGFIQYNFWGAVSTAATSPDASAAKLTQLKPSSSTSCEGQASKLVSPGALQGATANEAAFFDAFRASIMIMVGETLCEASAGRLINKIADAGSACEASASKLVNRTLDAATAAVGTAVKLVTRNGVAETTNPATATKVVQLKPLASTACEGTALKLVLTGIKLATSDSTAILLGGVQAVKSLVFTLGSYLAGKRGSIEPRVNLFLSNIRGEEIEAIATGESMSVNLANGRDHTWELAVRMAHSDVFDPLTDIVKPTLDYWNGETWDRFPLGLYRMSHPNEENLEHVRFWNLKGQSLESLLAEDMAPGSYSVPKNAGVLLEVKTILRTVFDVPDEAINFPAANEEVLLASPMFFDVATATEQCYWLPICNSLLAAAGFTPLQTDARGRFYTRKYQDPNIRMPDIRYGMGGDEIINAESAINIDRDASEFANRVIVISNDTTVAPIAAIAANHNPQSPYSIENYKKTVTKTVTLQNVVSNAEARLMAQVELARRSGIFEKLAFQTAPDPRRGPGEVLEVYIEDENGDPVISGLWMYEGWSMNLEPLSLQDHTASRITTTA